MTFLTAETFNLDGTTLVDFESVDPIAANNFEGETADFSTHTSAPLEGSQSIEGTSGADWIATYDFSTPRTDHNGNPIEYQLASRMPSNGSTMWLRTQVQDPSAGDGGIGDCYYLRLEADGDLKLKKRDSSTSTTSTDLFNGASGVSPSGGDEYVLGLKLTDSDLTGILYEHAGGGEAGAELFRASVSDTTHDGGYIGLGTGSAAGAVADSYVQMTAAVMDDFEDGLSEWSINTDANGNLGLQQVSDYPYTKTYSGFMDYGVDGSTPNATRTLFSDGGRPATIDFYWREISQSYGHAVRFINSSGAYELSLMSNNPQWEYEDASGLSTVYAGDGYERWIYVTVTPDWANGTFDIRWEDMTSGTVQSVTGASLINGVDIETIELAPFHNNEFYGAQHCDTWFDDIYASE